MKSRAFITFAAVVASIVVLPRHFLQLIWVVLGPYGKPIVGFLVGLLSAYIGVVQLPDQRAQVIMALLIGAFIGVGMTRWVEAERDRLGIRR